MMVADAVPRVVVAAAVVDRDGKYLVCRRLRGTHLAGLWEFPGGKCEPGEALRSCLARELIEELGCDAAVGEELLSIVHIYDDRAVELHFFTCTLLQEPTPRLGQEIRWVPREHLAALDFPPADDALIDLLMRQTEGR